METEIVTTLNKPWQYIFLEIKIFPLSYLEKLGQYICKCLKQLLYAQICKFHSHDLKTFQSSTQF